MILKNYTQTRGNRLAKLNVPDVTEPFGLKILWLRALSVENSVKNISRHKHKHSYFEAHFMFSGSMKYEVSGERTFVTEEGSGILISPEISHTVVELDPDLIKISIAFIPTESHDIFEKIARKKAHFFKMDDETISDFNRILSETDEKSTLSPYIIREKVFSVLCSIIREADPEAISEKAPCEPANDVRIASVIRFIDDNKNIFLTCEDVAQYCHFNVKYLNRIFKNQTGMTLLEYIHTSKIKEAERLLIETEYSLGDIAAMLGFANTYYFNSFFKRNCAISPGIYRKLRKKQ